MTADDQRTEWQVVRAERDRLGIDAGEVHDRRRLAYFGRG